MTPLKVFSLLFLLTQTAVGSLLLLSEDDFEHRVTTGWGQEVELLWTVYDNFVHFGMEAPTSGYIAVGFNPIDNGHWHMDSAVGWDDGTNEGRVGDFWTTDYDDVDLDTTEHLWNTTLLKTGGRLAMSFSRARPVNDDSQDGEFPLIDSDGFAKLVWAYDDEKPEKEGGRPDLEEHTRFNRGSLRVDMLGGTATGVPEGVLGVKNAVSAHGAAMLIGWFLFMGVGAIASGTEAHARCTSCGTLIVFVAVGLATGIPGPRLFFLSIHGVFGLLLVLPLFFMTTSGAKVSVKRRVRGDASRPRAAHLTMGTLLLALALLNAFFGLSSAGLDFQHWLGRMWLGAGVIVALALMASGAAFLRGGGAMVVDEKKDAKAGLSYAERVKGKLSGEIGNIVDFGIGVKRSEKEEKVEAPAPPTPRPPTGAEESKV